MFKPGKFLAALLFAGAAAAQPNLKIMIPANPGGGWDQTGRLGPLAETQFRRALSISQGDASVFLTQPISATFLAVTALLIVVPWLVRRRRRAAQGRR